MTQDTFLPKKRTSPLFPLVFRLTPAWMLTHVVLDAVFGPGEISYDEDEEPDEGDLVLVAFLFFSFSD